MRGGIWMKTRGLFRLGLERRRAFTGYIYVFPFIVGFALFFVRPFVQSVIFSLSELRVTQTGYVLKFVGLNNYHYALRVDPSFVRAFTETMVQTLTAIPAVLVLSFFAATLLNQEFRGRTLARVIFFLPVILGAGVLVRMGQQQLMLGEGTAAGSGILSGQSVRFLFARLRLPVGFIQYITDAVDRIPGIVNASAIPILIFLAGLQSIPGSLYEAAQIEGATSWESFWKITFPLLSPLFMVNIVFVIVDSFAAGNNPVVQHIEGIAWGRGIYGVSVAMTWMYFSAVGLLLLIIFGLLSRRVFYHE